MSQTGQPSVSDRVAVFEAYFAEDAELTRFSYAARRILAMAATQFHRHGAAATSIRDITRACGLTPGALYKHFASKDELLDVLVSHGHDRLERRVAAALAGVGDDPEQRLAAFARAYVEAHLEHPEIAQVVRREYLHLSPGRHQRIVARRRAVREQLRDILGAGQCAGRFRPVDLRAGEEDRAATRLATMILDMCSRTSEWFDPAGGEAVEDVAQRYVLAVLRLAGCR